MWNNLQAMCSVVSTVHEVIQNCFANCGRSDVPVEKVEEIQSFTLSIADIDVLMSLSVC